LLAAASASRYGFIHHMKGKAEKTVQTAGPLWKDGMQVLKKRTMTVAVLLSGILSIALVASANATPRHGHKRSQQAITCDERGCSDRASPASLANAGVVTDANGGAVVISRRPTGCPHAFCGCEASLYLFGKIRPELNLAANWIRKFPRTSPAPGMAAARSGHVMVLMSHVEGNNWLVHDGNSGGGLTREHIRSINGYVIVNPRGAFADNSEAAGSKSNLN
jgi:hypothetical protein